MFFIYDGDGGDEAHVKPALQLGHGDAVLVSLHLVVVLLRQVEVDDALMSPDLSRDYTLVIMSSRISLKNLKKFFSIIFNHCCRIII